MLNVINIFKAINKASVLSDIKFQMAEGDFIGLVGHNGAGKTTLLRILATLYKQDKGSITYNNVDIFSDAENYRSLIGYMPEDAALYNKLTASQNLEFYSKFYNGISEKDIFFMLDQLNIDHKRKIGTFSKGMKQKVLFIKTIIHNPSILLLDEPFNTLDPSTRIEIKGILKKFKIENKMLILSSHVLSDLTDICNRIIFLRRGRIVLDQPLHEINKNGQTLEEVYKNIMI